MTNLQTLMNKTAAQGGSDLHLQAGERPWVRVHGTLSPLEGASPISAEELEPRLLGLLEAEQRRRLRAQGHLDFSYQSSESHRWRCHIYQERTALAGAFRALPTTVPTLSELRLPKQIERLVHLRRGLVLITGATGSGKSTTLAAILRAINHTYHRHIVTIEDPIEYLHQDQLSNVQQRAVGVDVPSFHQGVNDTLHQDVDVLVIGELRDYQTARAALTAAETGTLVFGTLHSTDVPQTIERILDLFGGEEQGLARVILSHCLEAVVSQTLLKERGEAGQVPACEIMFRTPAIAGLIRADRIHDLRNSLQTGRSAGMCSLDDSLTALVTQRAVTQDEALRYTRTERLLGRGKQEWYLGGTEGSRA